MSSEKLVATDLRAACERFMLRPALPEHAVEALRSELVHAMAMMCDEFGLIGHVQVLRVAAQSMRESAVSEFGREEDETA